jgi:hypothetical protein
MIMFFSGSLTGLKDYVRNVSGRPTTEIAWERWCGRLIQQYDPKVKARPIDLETISFPHQAVRS